MAMEAMNKRRIRLNFKDGNILSKTQKKIGLKRSWLLLKPHHRTISDLLSYILDSFTLHHSCPHGILLSLDGFVLPPFESTTILKDKDLVSVKRKESGVKAIKEGKTSIEDKLVEKETLPSNVGLLANEEFNKEAGGYESESDVDEVEEEEPMQSGGARGDIVSKKRKASSPIEILEKKRPHQVPPSQKKRKKDGSNNEVNVKSTISSEPRIESIECDGKKEVSVFPSGVPDGAKKACGSGRGKKKQKQWKKSGITNENEEFVKKHSMKDLSEVSGSTKSKDANMEQPAEKDGNNVQKGQKPNGWDVKKNQENGWVQKKRESNGWNVMTNQENGWDVTNKQENGWVQKQHESNGWNVTKKQENGWNVTKKQENGWVQKNQESNGWVQKKQGNSWGVQSTQKIIWGDNSAQKNVRHFNKNKATKGTFSWKGQKWGKENQPSVWKGSRDYNGQTSNSGSIRSQPNSSWRQGKDQNGQSSSSWDSRRKSNDSYIEFKKLMPLTEPKVGDIIAYRLMELSSSWVPELSPFRVGKITSIDQETNKIMLVPEADYPLKLVRKAKNDDDDDDDYGQPPQPSVYNEDGSLEIDFPSLVDVRVVKSALPYHTPTNPANEKRDLWEAMSEALSAKKAQMQVDNWNKNENATNRSWSQRPLRTTGLDPRLQNGV